jgi:Ribbon-helix-helix protein, copG family
VSRKTETPTGRIASLTAHVPLDLAEAVRELADEGERSVSREVTRALREHVETARASKGSSRRSADPEDAAGLRESTRQARGLEVA